MSKRRNLITIIKQIQAGNIFLGDKIESVDVEIVKRSRKRTWIEKVVDKIIEPIPEPEIIEPIQEPEEEVILWNEKITTFNLEQYRGNHQRAIEHQMRHLF